MGGANDVGRQQITIYPYQDLTSINGDQILYGLFSQGAYNVQIELEDGAEGGSLGADNIGFIIKKGSTFMFEETVSDAVSATERTVLIKAVLEEDGYLRYSRENFISKAELWSNNAVFTDSSFLFLYATWSYDLENPTNRYVEFGIAGEASYASILAQSEHERNVIICKILNQQYFVDTYASGGDLSLGHYRISYEPKENRDYMNMLKTSLNQYLVEFDGDGEHAYVKIGEVLAGDTLVKNSSSLQITPPGQLAGSHSDSFQVDVLRHRYGNEDNTTMGPVIEWESFLFASPSNVVDWVWENDTSITRDMITTYLNGKRLDTTDPGYTILILVRAWNTITSPPVMWPNWCYIPNPLVPRVGTVESTTRVSLPIYD